MDPGHTPFKDPGYTLFRDPGNTPFKDPVYTLSLGIPGTLLVKKLSVISNDPPCKDDNAQYTKEPLRLTGLETLKW